MNQNLQPKNRRIKSYHVGGLPIIHSIAERMRLKEFLYQYIPPHKNEAIPSVETLILLIYNLTLGKSPLYELDKWVRSIDFRCINIEQYQDVSFNDDRFGRGLNKLYNIDRASLMTKFVVFVVREFGVLIDRFHNDSTSVKAFGKFPGKTKTGLELKQGNSKDHRPDLKQLVFCLSVSSDGAIPIHHKCYSGNVTDDQTHIETWNTLKKIAPSPDFLYVADSKLCTDEQLFHIVDNGGRAITIIPETWKEVMLFKEELRKKKKGKDIIWRRKKPGGFDEQEYFSKFKGSYYTKKRGYKIHWIYSSEKCKRDRESREKYLNKVEQRLTNLNGKTNKRKLKTKSAIEEASKKILEEYNAKNFFHITIGEITETYRIQAGKGRPGKNTRYTTRQNKLYTLTWTRKKKVLKEEANIDGVFPLICTDTSLSAKEVLKTYKYQPRLEKRFTQFKKVHSAAPLFFKKVERVEANMFGFFCALMIQALIEREVRNKMKEKKIEKIIVYPEERETSHPTTNKILSLFDNICTYQIIEDDRVVETFRDNLDDDQKLILSLLDIKEDQYWNGCSKIEN
jgi:transposase